VTVSAPADRRFKRARVKPARRRRLWRRYLVPVLKWAVAAAITLAATNAALNAVADARVLHVTDIVVHGNDRLSSGDVATLLSEVRGQNLLWLDLEDARQKLLASPWIRDVSIRRTLPSTVVVTISEREPIGIGRLNDTLYLVDESGTVIDEYGAVYADVDVPIIDGLAGRGKDGSRADPERAAFAGRVITALRPDRELAERVSQLDVTDPRNARVILSGDQAVIQLGADRFLARLQTYVEVASAVRARVPDIESVDLRFDDRIYVRPSGGRGGQTVAIAPAADSTGGRRQREGRGRQPRRR
jgi:cell division protein FtsQ